jgi:hypothetical protein
LRTGKKIGKIGSVSLLNHSIVKEDDQEMVSLVFSMDRKFMMKFAGIGIQYTDDTEKEKRFNEFMRGVSSQFVRDFLSKVDSVKEFSINEDVLYGINWKTGLTVISFEFKPGVPDHILNTTIDYIEDYFSDPEYEYVINIMMDVDKYMKRIDSIDFENFLYRNDDNNIGFAKSRLEMLKSYYAASTNIATEIIDDIIVHKDMMRKLRSDKKENTDA